MHKPRNPHTSSHGGATAAMSVTDRTWLAAMCIANGLPVATAGLLMAMLKRFGTGNTAITTHMALALTPWMLRPLCNMLMRRVAWRKEWWLAGTEAAMVATTAALGWLVGSDGWLAKATTMLTILSAASMIHCVVTESLYKELTRNTYAVELRPMFVTAHALAMLAGLGLMAMVAGNIEVMTRNIYQAWRVAFRLTAAAHAVLAAFSVWKAYGRRNTAQQRADIDNVAGWKEMTGVMRLFFGNHSVSIGATFFALFAMPLGLTAVMTPLFMTDSIHHGGLGLAPQEFGLTCGTVGTVGLTVGFLAAIRTQKHIHLDNLLLPVALLSTVAPLSLLVLSNCQAPSLTLANACMLAGGASAGMTVAALASFLAYYSCGKYKHVFFSTGMAVTTASVAAAAYIAGPLQHYCGYQGFFATAICACGVSVGSALLLVTKCFGWKN